MNIERNEERILLKYVDASFNTYKCVITDTDVFVVNFCRRDLAKMEKILHNNILEKFDDYYVLKVEDPVCLEYQLKKEKQEEINLKLILEKIKKLEEDNKKLCNNVQRLDKITNELLFENRILREYVPIIDTTIYSIQKEINDANKLRENEKEIISKLFNQIKNDIENQDEKIESYEEIQESLDEENNILNQRITNCEYSIKDIKKITDENMVRILRVIDHIYTIIDRSKNLIFNRINEIFGGHEEVNHSGKTVKTGVL